MVLRGKVMAGASLSVVMLLIALVSIGCASNGTGAGSTTTTVSQSTIVTTIGWPAAVVTTTVNAGESPVDNPSISRVDTAGNTPEAVVLKLVATLNSFNWSSAYAQYAKPYVEYSVAEQEWMQRYEHYSYFVVHETRVERDDLAFVRVSYAITYPLSSVWTGQPKVGEPEWWAVDKVDGCWKTRWMPAQ